jgi:hypothetical protein
MTIQEFETQITAILGGTPPRGVDGSLGLTKAKLKQLFMTVPELKPDVDKIHEVLVLNAATLNTSTAAVGDFVVCNHVLYRIELLPAPGGALPAGWLKEIISPRTWNTLGGKPATFPPAAHTHSLADLPASFHAFDDITAKPAAYARYRSVVAAPGQTVYIVTGLGATEKSHVSVLVGSLITMEHVSVMCNGLSQYSGSRRGSTMQLGGFRLATGVIVFELKNNSATETVTAMVAVDRMGANGLSGSSAILDITTVEPTGTIAENAFFLLPEDTYNPTAHRHGVLSGGMTIASELYTTSISATGAKEVYIEVVHWSSSTISTPTLGYVAVMVDTSGNLTLKGAKKVGEAITNMKVCIYEGNLAIRFNTSTGGRYRQVKAYNMIQPAGEHKDQVTGALNKPANTGETKTIDITFTNPSIGWGDIVGDNNLGIYFSDITGAVTSHRIVMGQSGADFIVAKVVGSTLTPIAVFTPDGILNVTGGFNGSGNLNFGGDSNISGNLNVGGIANLSELRLAGGKIGMGVSPAVALTYLIELHCVNKNLLKIATDLELQNPSTTARLLTWNRPANSGNGNVGYSDIVVRRTEIGTVSTGANGQAVFTFPLPAFAAVPHVQATLIGGIDNHILKVLTVTTTTVTVQVVNRVDSAGALPSFSNVNGATVNIEVTAK